MSASTQAGQNVADADRQPKVHTPDLFARRRTYQCPGCYSCVSLLPPSAGRTYECDCGEALTCTDLRGDEP